MTYTFTENRISEHFTWFELACHDKANSIISNEEVLYFTQVLLEEFRAWYNRSIVPESWYRTQEYNDSIAGSSSNSKHVRGIAIDVHFPKNEGLDSWRKNEFLGNVKDKWYEILKSHNMTGGVGFYDWGFHIDAGNDTDDMRFWDYRTL